MMLSDVLSDSRISRVIELALLEDTGHGDLTSDAVISDSDLGKGDLLCKEDGIVAGMQVATLVFQHCHRSITVTPVVSDGGQVYRQQVIATVDGKAKSILRAERTALNFLQRNVKNFFLRKSPTDHALIHSDVTEHRLDGDLTCLVRATDCKSQTWIVCTFLHSLSTETCYV